MLDVGNGVEKLKHLFRTEYHRQSLWLFGSGDNVVEMPIFLERHLVKKPKRRSDDEDRAGGQLSFVSQIDLVGPNFLGP